MSFRQAPESAEPAEPSWLHELWLWTEQNGDVVAWMFTLSLLSLVLCLLLLPVIVVRLPPDYFSPQRDKLPAPSGLVGWLLRLGRNLIGALFVVVGVVLLLLPGQGMLMILIGLLLVDFPGKRGLERRIVARPTILRLLNRMRRRRARPPLVVD